MKQLLAEMRDTLKNLKKDKDKWQNEIAQMEISMNQLIIKIRVRFCSLQRKFCTCVYLYYSNFFQGYSYATGGYRYRVYEIDERLAE